MDVVAVEKPVIAIPSERNSRTGTIAQGAQQMCIKSFMIVRRTPAVPILTRVAPSATAARNRRSCPWRAPHADVGNFLMRIRSRSWRRAAKNGRTLSGALNRGHGHEAFTAMFRAPLPGDSDRASSGATRPWWLPPPRSPGSAPAGSCGVGARSGQFKGQFVGVQVWMRSNIRTACLALLVWRRPMKCTSRRSLGGLRICPALPGCSFPRCRIPPRRSLAGWPRRKRLADRHQADAAACPAGGGGGD